MLNTLSLRNNSTNLSICSVVILSTIFLLSFINSITICAEFNPIIPYKKIFIQYNIRSCLKIIHSFNISYKILLYCYINIHSSELSTSHLQITAQWEQDYCDLQMWEQDYCDLQIISDRCLVSDNWFRYILNMPFYWIAWWKVLNGMLSRIITWELPCTREKDSNLSQSWHYSLY